MDATRTKSPNKAWPRSGLVAWYNEHSYRFGLANGSAVLQLTDMTGSGHNLVNPSSSFAPTYVSGGLNHLPTLSFPNTFDRYLSGGVVLSGTQARSLYFVANVGQVSTADLIDLNGVGPGNFWAVTGEFGFRAGAAGGREAFTPAPTGGVWAILTVRMPEQGAASGVTARLNSVNLTVASSVAGVPNTGAGGVLLGGGPSAGSGRFWGQMAEILIFGVSHTDAQSAQVETYLRKKWGL